MTKFTKATLIPAALATAALIAGPVTSTSLAQDRDQGAEPKRVAHWDGYGSKGPKGRGGRGMMRSMFKNADTDKDGAVTQEELDAYRLTLVEKADADGDGNLTVKEYETIYLELAKPRIVRSFQRLDTDADGIVTKEEQDAPFENLVSRMDRNGDGKLSRDDRPEPRPYRGHRRGHGKY